MPWTDRETERHKQIKEDKTKGERRRQYRVNNLKWGKVKTYYTYTILNIHNLEVALCRKLPDICSSCFGWQNRKIETVK